MITFLLAAALTLEMSSPPVPDAEYRVYTSTTPNSFSNYVAFRDTNRFTLTNVPPETRLFVALSIWMAGATESELTEPISVIVFNGVVQAAPTMSGPWTNYLTFTIPIELVSTQLVLRSVLHPHQPPPPLPMARKL